MNINDVDKIVAELKDFNLIGPNRKVIADHKVYCNSSALFSIKFDPIALNFMDEGGFIWLLLHEEAHLIFPQKRYFAMAVRGFLKIAIYVILILFLTALIVNNIPKNFNPIVVILVLVVITLTIVLGIGYIEEHLIYPLFSSRINKPYWDDEFKCDEYGVMGLLLVRPNLIAWQEARSSLDSFKKCREKRGKPGLIDRKIGQTQSYPHPPIPMRVFRMKTLYEKFKAKKSL